MTDTVYVISGAPDPNALSPVSPTVADAITATQTALIAAQAAAASALAQATAAATSATSASGSSGTAATSLATAQSLLNSLSAQLAEIGIVYTQIIAGQGTLAEVQALAATVASQVASIQALITAAGQGTVISVEGMGGVVTGLLLAANNLSDVASAATSRTNLGINLGVANGVATLNASGIVPSAQSLVQSVAGRTGAITIASTDITDATTIGKGLLTAANTAAVTAQGLAILASPVFSGAPTAPTQTTGDSSLKLSNTAFVAATIASLPNISSGGRITLTSGVPILMSSVAGATSIIWTPYHGNGMPLWTGSGWTYFAVAELSQALTDTTRSPAAAAASSLYDIFMWLPGGVPGISRGPAWTSSTARGSGSGTSQLTLVQGYYTNQFAITNGPGAGAGLYLGTIATNASSTVDFILGSSASGGGAASLGIWNTFNRRPFQPAVVDNGASYTYTSSTVRAARASTSNSITFVYGIGEDATQASYLAFGTTVASSFAYEFNGIGLDSTSAYYRGLCAYNQAQVAAAITVILNPATYIPPQLGQHFIQALEQSDGSHANIFNSNAENLLQAIVWA